MMCWVQLCGKSLFPNVDRPFEHPCERSDARLEMAESGQTMKRHGARRRSGSERRKLTPLRHSRFRISDGHVDRQRTFRSIKLALAPHQRA
jgi:hypothetical protein